MEVVKAIVLKSIRYTDSQKIIRVYTREKGSLSLLSPSSVFKRKDNAVHVMEGVEIEYLENDKGDLHKLGTIAPIVSTPNLYFDIFKMNIILLWAEVLSLVLKDEGRNEDLFDYVLRSTEYLNTTSSNAGNFNLFFLYRLASFIGFRINADTWKEGYVFSPYDGNFHDPKSGGSHISGPNTARVIHALCTCKPEELKDIALDRQSRNVLLDVILLFFGTHLNLDFNIKSIQVIREIFA